MNFKAIKRSLLVLGLLSGAASINGASAAEPEKEISFRPVAPWKLESAGGEACAMRNQFNNGFTMDFNGKGSAPSALDIDFRQDIFSQGQSYEAALSVPGGAAQKFPARANSAGSLSVDLKARPGFFDSLRKASVLDFNVEGNDFRFYLTGFAAASKSFADCGKPAPAAAEAKAEIVNESIAFEQREAEALKSGAPAIPVVDTTKAAAVAQPIPYTEKTLLGGREIPKSERARMSEKLAEEIASNPKIIEDAEISASAKPVKAFDKKPAETVEMEKSAPMEQPREMAAAAAPDEKPAAVLMPVKAEADKAPPPPPVTAKEAQASRLENEIIRFNQPRAGAASPPKITETESRSTPPAKINKQTIKATVDLTDMPADIEPAGAPAADEPFAQFSRSGARKADPELLEKISDLESSVSVLKKENDALNAELKSSLRESRDETLSISNSNWNLEKATLAYNESERQMKRLGQELAKERAQCQMEKQEIEAQLFDPQVTDQRQLARLSELERKLAEAQRQLEDQRLQFEERIRLMQQRTASAE